MDENSEEFNQGIGLLNFQVYEGAINLFQQDIEQNPNNLASYHNIGLAKTYLGVDKKDKAMLQSAIEHLEKAIAIANELNYTDGYPIAETNLKWATEELAKLK
jgi:tetratricopeptide (TPR) repeat protein